MADIHPLKSADAKLCVLKFGSSVLESEDDYHRAAQEMYRHVRLGERVVALVSALAGETDALFAQAERLGGDPSGKLVARLVRVGELRSAALMALALRRIGLRACTLDPHEMDLKAEGSPLDANLSGLDRPSVEATLADNEVVVVPGFIADHDQHGVVTLGRGGTDLSAVFFAARLGARRVRLIKDVDGVYDSDPAKNPKAERYGTLDYDSAAKASAGLIQAKAIDAAKEAQIAIEVAAVGNHEATVVGALPSAKAMPPQPRRLRVALLGCGVVGTGVLHHLAARPDWFELGPVLVRDPAKHDASQHRFTADPAEALAGDPDVVVELMGGRGLALELMAKALRAGASVVTANKAAVAGDHDLLSASANAEDQLRFSGAVGGGTPVLETIDRLRSAGLRSVDGVMNGTANYLLGRLADGVSMDDAISEAQRLGFTEADPSGDVDGHDAADKLSILARAAFGVALAPEQIARESLRSLSADAVVAAAARGLVVKQVGRCWLGDDGNVHGQVRLEHLPAANPLAGLRNEENGFVLRGLDGRLHEVHGKGAGRLPTAAAVFADVMDVQRVLAFRPPVAMQMRLSA